MADYRNEIQKLYIAYYGRPADYSGLEYWNLQANNAGGVTTSIIDNFGTSAEATSRFGSMTVEARINDIYLSTFGRAAETAGSNYWVGEYVAGRVTLAGIASAVVNGAKNDDATVVANKLTASTSFTNALAADSAKQIKYSGTDAANSAKTWLATVTSSAATVTTATASINTTIDGMTGTAAVGSSFTLTTDTITTASATADLAFNAPTGAMVQTLQTGDRMTGDSTGTLTATLNGTAATPTITNVPTQNYTVIADTTLTANNISGTTLINVASGSVAGATLSVTGASSSTTFKISGNGGLNANAAAASSNTTITLEGANATTNGDGLTIGANYATATLTSSGTTANVVDLDGIAGLTAADSLTVGGSADLTLTYQDATITAAAIATALKASTHTATLTLKQTDAQTTNRDISASEGVDVWHFAGGVASKALTFDAGTTIKYSDTDGAANTQGYTLGSIAGSTDKVSVEYNAISATNGFDIGASTFTGIEQVEITSNGTLNTGVANSVAEVAFSADNALVTESITVKGSAALTITEITAIGAARYTVDATSFTGVFSMTDTAANQLATVKLGSGTSTVNLTGGTSTDFAVAVETGTGNAAIDFGTTGTDDDQELVIVLSKNAGQAISIDGLDIGDTANIAATAGVDDYIDLSAFESTLVVTNGGVAGAGGTITAMSSATAFATGTNIGYYDSGADDYIYIDVNGDGAYASGSDMSIKMTGITGVGANLAYVLDSAGLLWLA